MATFRVKNFERFQHYKDRNPPWIKLYNELLDDYGFACLQDASKLHLILIWLLASRSNNILPFDSSWIAKRINATSKVDLQVLIDAGFLIINQRLHNGEQVASNTLADCPDIARPERETEEEKEIERDSDQKEDGWPRDYRERFWAEYPRKVGKKAAIAKLEAVRKSGEVGFDVLLAAIKSIETKDEKFIPHPTTWLSQGRYLDQPATPSFVPPDNIEELRARYELRKAAQS